VTLAWKCTVNGAGPNAGVRLKFPVSDGATVTFITAVTSSFSLSLPYPVTR